jgi:hypothetical protein
VLPLRPPGPASSPVSDRRALAWLVLAWLVLAWLVLAWLVLALEPKLLSRLSDVL